MQMRADAVVPAGATSKVSKKVKKRMLKAALKYARRGWSVLPLQTVRDGTCSCGKPDCEHPGKHPCYDGHLLPNGHKSATTDEMTIRRWFKQWPEANIGIATGVESGLVVLDVDREHGGIKTFTELLGRHGVLPKTVQVGTGGGGVHVYFKAPDVPVQIGCSVGRLGRGLDIRADGGYIVAPPSKHGSGKRYQWRADHSPEEQALAPLPAWLLDTLKQPHAPANNPVVKADEASSAAMKMVGHKTQSIYARYAIADESMLKDGAVRLSTLHAHEVEAAERARVEGVVVPITTARSRSGKVRAKSGR
jgi:hypothetical protein